MLIFLFFSGAQKNTYTILNQGRFQGNNKVEWLCFFIISPPYKMTLSWRHTTNIIVLIIVVFS